MGRRKGGGGKLNRSEIVQARLSPKIKFGSELIAKDKRCTLSSLIESSLEEQFLHYQFKVHKNVHPSGERSASDLLERIWSPEEGVRFVRIAYLLPNLLTHEEEDFFHYLTRINYFWSFYEITYKDAQGNVLRTEWRRHHSVDSLVEEHLNEYWYAIKDNDVPLKQKIPKEMGKKISVPQGVEAEFIESADNNRPVINVDGLFPIDHQTIWRENIAQLIKHEIEVVDTSEGSKKRIKIIYPTPEEQKEMVERIYQEHMQWHSSSRK